MILQPRQMWSMERELETPKNEQAFKKLTVLHDRYRINENTGVRIPLYWSEIVLAGMEEILYSFPQVKFGGIIEYRNRLKFYTIPTHKPLETVRYKLYNKLDQYIINCIDDLLSRRKRPHFLGL